MESEVNPKVLAVIEEGRLSGPRLSPADVIARMGVLDARSKPFETAWLATGDSVIATVWGEHVNVSADGRWFCVESLNTEARADGGERNASQVQRATNRLTLLKRSFDAAGDFRAVLQTNRMPIDEAESSKNAKISTRVRDDEPWHVASWSPELQIAVLVRGARGWQPSDEQLKTARRSHASSGPRSGASASAPAASGAPGEVDVDGAAKAYVLKHFSSYGYQAEDVSGKDVGYDVEVRDKKGALLLQVCVRGASVGTPMRVLSAQEQTASAREKLWRLIVVADPLTGAAQHKIHKPNEIPQGLLGA